MTHALIFDNLNVTSPPEWAPLNSFLVQMALLRLLPIQPGKGQPDTRYITSTKRRQKLLASKKRFKAATDPVPEGTFRYEIQVPRVALRKNHIYTLDLLTPDRIHKMGLSYWDNSNYGNPLTWAGQAAVEMGTVMSDTEVAETIQYINNVQLGVPMSYSKKDQKRIEGLIKKSGFSMKKPLHQQGLPYGSLDFKSGGLSPIP